MEGLLKPVPGASVTPPVASCTPMRLGLIGVGAIGTNFLEGVARGPAERGIGSDASDGRGVVFEGPAREAVRLFPANVNVAAAVSLAGIGPERTRVRLVADPALDGNVHELHARGAFGELRLRL